MVSLRRPHYAWIICLGGALSLFAVMGMGINVFSVYQPYIIQLNGFSNAQGSWITTTRSLFTLAAMLTVNQLCARIGLRLVMTLGVVLLALSCFCFGLADSFPLYCAAGALTGLAYGYGGMVPLSLAVGHWFRDRRGLALGLAAAGSGVSTIFVPTLITGIIQAHGMRAAFLLEGLAVLVLGLLVFLLVRDVPGDLGLEPYHLGGPETPAPPPRPAPAGMTPALRLSLLLAVFLIGGPGGPVSPTSRCSTPPPAMTAPPPLCSSLTWGWSSAYPRSSAARSMTALAAGRATGTSIWSFWPDCSCAVWPTWVGCSPLSRP